MNRVLNALSQFSMCVAICLMVCGAFAFSPSSAAAEEPGTSNSSNNCPCSRCVNGCGGLAPCLGKCNSPDQTCQNAGQTCNCSCTNNGMPSENCTCI